MDCRTARLLLDYARPQLSELPPSDSDALEAHLAGCVECDALSRAERQVDERLGQAMRDVPMPEGLHDRILARIQSERGDQQRRWLGWTVRAAAVAALVLLTVWIGVIWYAKKPRALDLWELQEEMFTRDTSADPGKVAAWFHEHYKLKTTAPTGFNYRFLKHYDLAECQGRRVPMLFFTRGDTEARVFVISNEQFDLAALDQSEPLDSAGYHVEVLRDDRDANHAFVAVYKGESLKPLLLDESGPSS
jgi:hypothetical protein